MLSKEEIEILSEVLKLLEYVDYLEEENKALKKGITSLIASRKKWKNKYYKEKRKSRKFK